MCTVYTLWSKNAGSPGYSTEYHFEKKLHMSMGQIFTKVFHLYLYSVLTLLKKVPESIVYVVSLILEGHMTANYK